MKLFWIPGAASHPCRGRKREPAAGDRSGYDARQRRGLEGDARLLLVAEKGGGMREGELFPLGIDAKLSSRNTDSHPAGYLGTPAPGWPNWLSQSLRFASKAPSARFPWVEPRVWLRRSTSTVFCFYSFDLALVFCN